jgi:pimeloyl-ACP methyl ester carboxylesterase
MSRVETIGMAERGVCLDVVVDGVVEGERPTVVLLPSAQRGAGDFARLAGDLAAAGYGTAAVNMRGVGASTGPLDGLTLRDVADDVAGVIVAICRTPAHVVGHALGNVFARATAAYRPEVVRSVTLLACGGHEDSHVSLDPDLLAHFERCTRDDLPDDRRLESLQEVFFAPGSDPSVWISGWYPGGDTRAVFETSAAADWATAGEAPVLVLQPLQDRLCAPEVGRELCRRLGARGRYVELPRCGHAILPEQPELVAQELVRFLRDIDGEQRTGGPS